jgi:flagellar basal-body rod protein FlgG
MMAQMVRQDVLANNLANVNTAGYKKDTATSRAFPEMLLQRLGEVEEDHGVKKPAPPVVIGSMGTGVTISQIATDFASGPLKSTENPYDLALRSDGYFTIETPEGLRYTRDGSFQVNSDGRLVTTNGYPVMGTNGYIDLNGDITVDEKGNVTSNGENVGTLNIVTFTDPKQLMKMGDNLYQPRDQEAQTTDDPQVLQGYLESSNVNAVREMVDLITVVRTYEVLQKTVQSEDETLDKAVNQVGSI